VERLPVRLVRLLKGSKGVFVVFLISGWLEPLDIAVMSSKGAEMNDCGPNRSERLSEEDEGTAVVGGAADGWPRSARNSKV